MPSSSAVLKEGETLPRQIRLSKATKVETHTFVVLMMNCAFKRNLQDWLITNYARVKQLSQDHNHITTHIGGTCSEGCAHALVEGEPCVRRAAAPPASISPRGSKSRRENASWRESGALAELDPYFLGLRRGVQSEKMLLPQVSLRVHRNCLQCCTWKIFNDLSFIITIKEDKLTKRGRRAALIATIESF